MLRNETNNSTAGSRVKTQQEHSGIKNSTVRQSSPEAGKTAQFKGKKCNLPAVIVLAVMALYLVSEHLLSGNYINSSNPYVTVVIAQLCVYLVPCAFFFAFSSLGGRVSTASYGLQGFSLRSFGFVTASLFALVIGGMLIKYAGYLVFGTVNSSAVAVSANNDVLYVLLSAVIIPAITEELLFRGVVYGIYEKSLGSFGAILCTSVLFALIHFDSVNFVSYLYAGIILSVAVCVTRSVFAPMLLHLLNNFLCIFSDTYIQRIAKESISTVFVVFILAVILLAVLFFYFESLELFCRDKAEETPYADPSSPGLFIPNEKKHLMLSRSFMAPAFLAAVIVYLAKVMLLQ